MTSTRSRFSEPSMALRICSGRLFGGCSPGVGIRPKIESELGGDDHLAFEGRKGFADQLFVDKGAIDFGGIKERDAAIDGRMQHRGHLLLVLGWPVAEAHAHAAQTEGGNFKVAFA